MRVCKSMCASEKTIEREKDNQTSVRERERLKERKIAKQ